MLKMKAEVYFILLLCGIFSQGICSVSEDNNEKSSDLHVRQKRIAGGVRRPVEHAVYIVAILVHGNYQCPATLLTNDVAITSAECVKNLNQRVMTIQSAGDQSHQILRINFLDPNYNSSRPTVNNLVLIGFSPAINPSHSHNRPISLFNGNMAEEEFTFQVFNWGRPLCLGVSRIPGIYLRSIFIRPISIEYCQSLYPGIIGRGNLCAYAEKPKEHCHDRDTGAPLVVDGKLIGIMVFHGFSHHVNPDVFMNLMDNQIRRWIHEHVPALRLF